MFKNIHYLYVAIVCPRFPLVRQSFHPSRGLPGGEAGQEAWPLFTPLPPSPTIPTGVHVAKVVTTDPPTQRCPLFTLPVCPLLAYS